MFERFTDEARTAIVLSQSYAQLLKDDQRVGTQHLLMGLALPDRFVGLALADLGVACDQVRGAILERCGAGTTMPPGHIPFTPAMQWVLENSQREAAALNHDYVGPAHLMLALLQESESTACQILAEQVGELSRVRSAVLDRLATQPPTPAETRPPDSEITAAPTDHRPPGPAASTESAQWLTQRDRLGPHWVTNAVGAGFQAYARLLHPYDDHPSGQTWAAEARANGHTLHPSVDWKKIVSDELKAQFAQGRGGPGWPGSPSRGHLPTWALEALCAILARHTTTPHTCYFALWESGEFLTPSRMTARYAPQVRPPGPAPVEWQLDASAPTFSWSVPLPGGDQHSSKYYLYEGDIGDAIRIGHWADERRFYPRTPDFFWPADYAWRVATAPHSDSTIIGGSRQLIDELCGLSRRWRWWRRRRRASETIEVLQIAPDAPQEDQINV